MFKHRKEKKSLENEFDQTVDETVDEDPEEDVTMKNTNDKNEECDEIVIVDVEIVNLDDKKKSENDVQESNADDDENIKHNKRDAIEVVNVVSANVKIVDVGDDTIEIRSSDNILKASDNNSELDKNQIPEIMTGSFVCKICDVKAKNKHDLANHKVSTHNWCTKCFSTFDSQDKLQNHLTTKHKKLRK